MAYIEVAFCIAENCSVLGKRAEIAAVGSHHLLCPARVVLGIVDVADVRGIGRTKKGKASAKARTYWTSRFRTGLSAM